MSGEELKIFIKKQGYNVSSLAKILETSQQNLDRALTAESVKTSLLEKICSKLDMKINDFYVDTPYGITTKEAIRASNQPEIIQRLMDMLEQKGDELRQKDEIIQKLYGENMKLMASMAELKK